MLIKLGFKLFTKSYDVKIPETKSLRTFGYSHYINSYNDQGTKQLFMEKGMLSGVKTLDKCISAKTYDLAKRKASEFGLDIQMFSKFKRYLTHYGLLDIKYPLKFKLKLLDKFNIINRNKE